MAPEVPQRRHGPTLTIEPGNRRDRAKLLHLRYPSSAGAVGNITSIDVARNYILILFKSGIMVVPRGRRILDIGIKPSSMS